MSTRYLLVLALFATVPTVLAQQTFDPRPLVDSPVASGANFDNPRLDNDFFDTTTYLGAFAPNGERWDLPWANYDPEWTDYGDPADAVIVDSDITSNTTWTADNSYMIVGFVTVTEGNTLTIEPGTIIFGQDISKGTLIIARGAKIISDGEPHAPIVFTSEYPVGQRAGGDWGGVIITGRASINVEGGEAIIEGGTGAVYGGGDNPNDDDNSGIFRYSRIEFAGIEYSQDNEINGLTMGGVGRETTIEYVQVSFCDDDSFEWFGGTVDARYLISLAALDDDFDGDTGWRGSFQYGLIVRDPDLADISGSNAFEQDNASSEPDPPHTPRSAPVISNITVFGPLLYSDNIDPNYRHGAHIRRASRASLYNSVIVGFPTGVRLDGPNVRADAENEILQIRNSILTGPFVSNQDGFDVTGWITTSAFANQIVELSDVATWFESPVVSNEAGPTIGQVLGVSLSAYPNPAVDQMTVVVELDGSENITIELFDMLGRRHATLFSGLAIAGEQEIGIDTNSLASGSYIVRLITERGAINEMVSIVR